MRDSVKFQKNSNKKSRKNNHKNGGFEWYRRLGKNAVKTMKNLPYGMLSALLKNEMGESKMTREEKVAELERMLAKVPDVMSPLKASKCSPFGKNKIYELIKTKELRAFVFQGSYIIAKVDLIETIVDHSDRQGRTYKIGHEVK